MRTANEIRDDDGPHPNGGLTYEAWCSALPLGSTPLAWIDVPKSEKDAWQAAGVAARDDGTPLTRPTEPR